MLSRDEEEERETQDPPSHPEGGAPVVLRNEEAGACGYRCRPGMKKRKEKPKTHPLTPCQVPGDPLQSVPGHPLQLDPRNLQQGPNARRSSSIGRQGRFHGSA